MINLVNRRCRELLLRRQGHPMKPHRIRMAHNLLLNYGLYRKMEIYVSCIVCLFVCLFVTLVKIKIVVVV